MTDSDLNAITWQTEMREILDTFAEKHGFGKLTAEFRIHAPDKTESHDIIIWEGEEQHQLFRDDLFKITGSHKITPENLTAYLTKLETSEVYTVVGHDDLTLYKVDMVKSRRDYQVRERQNKLGRDKDLPVPDAKNCNIGDTVLIHDPRTRCSSYMIIESIEKKSVILHCIASQTASKKLH